MLVMSNKLHKVHAMLNFYPFLRLKYFLYTVFNLLSIKTLAAKPVLLASDVPLNGGHYVGDKKRILNLSKF